MNLGTWVKQMLLAKMFFFLLLNMEGKKPLGMSMWGMGQGSLCDSKGQASQTLHSTCKDQIKHKRLGRFCHIMTVISIMSCLWVMWTLCEHSWYLSPPPPPAVVYFFQAGALFCTENAKFGPILANLGYFVANLRTFWCTFTGRWCPKIDKYQVCAPQHVNVF